MWGALITAGRFWIVTSLGSGGGGRRKRRRKRRFTLPDSNAGVLATF